VNRIVLSRRAASRTPHSPRDAGFRPCVRSAVVCVAFPLVAPLPSTDSAATVGLALFARFCGTMGTSDSPVTCMSAVRLLALSDRSSPPFDKEVTGVSRFPCIELPRMRRVFDSGASTRGSRCSSLMVLPSP
jgi:hypothetical protein